MSDVKTLAADLLGAPLRVHLIGVAGSGMSGLAGLLLALGHRVCGSDKVTTVETDRLQQLGLVFHCPQNAAAIADTELVIYSSAIKRGNVEFDEAIRLRKKMVRRAEALAAILESRRGIVVAGMHGKTTTSAMLAHVLRVGGLKPSHYVGAEIPILGVNANWDAGGEFFVAEGDESDGTLALYHPEHAIVLNIEEEHLDHYADLAAIERVFNQFLDQTRGRVFYCADDANAARVCAVRPRAISFGENPAADYRFENVESGNLQTTFQVIHRGSRLGSLTLNVPGRHNVSNALSVIAVATELGVSFAKIAEALAGFRGARRRFEVKYSSEHYLVVDDYAHHPSEIRATLATAKTTGRKRILAMFQPHRYTRTQALAAEFGRAFDDAALVFVSDIYPASEQPIPGISGQTIVDAMSVHGHVGAHFEPERRKIAGALGRQLEPGDLVLSMGAGDIHEQGAEIARDLPVLEEIQCLVGSGLVRLYEPIAKHTTLRVGGPAQFWVEPETEAGFAALVRFCTQTGLPLFVMGRGSNLLVRDGGIRGVVAHLVRGEFKKIDVNGSEIVAGSGAKMRELAYAARDANLGGFEWMEGIPGNVGGGLRMNAGAMGGELFDNVLWVRWVDAGGNLQTKNKSELDVRYRSVPDLRQNYAVAAAFRGAPGQRAEIVGKLNESMHKRRATQPKESSAGCIFKNPKPQQAGKLIDELGLKNTSVGHARVSEIHGNFIVNDGGASAADVLALIDKIKIVAREKRGIELETEVQIVGEDSFS